METKSDEKVLQSCPHCQKNHIIIMEICLETSRPEVHKPVSGFRLWEDTGECTLPGNDILHVAITNIKDARRNPAP